MNNSVEHGHTEDAIGIVKLVIGEVLAENPDGKTRTLQVNSPVFFNDTIITGAPGMTSIVFNDSAGSQLDLGRMSTVLIDEDVYPETEGPTVMSNETADIEDIQQGLLAGTLDPTTELEATAAGPAAGEAADGGGGHVIYREELIADEVTPDAGADTTPVGFDFTGSDPDPLLVETVDEPAAAPAAAAVIVADEEDEDEDEPLTAEDFYSCFGYSSYTGTGDSPPEVEIDVLANDEGGGVGSILTSVSISSASIGTVRIENNLIYFEPGIDFSEETTVSYTFTNADGEEVQGTLTIYERYFILGENIDDNEDSDTAYVVGEGSGTITGGVANDILVGDYGGADEEGNSLNLILILDTSSSMDDTGTGTESRLELLQEAVDDLLAGLSTSSYDNVRVHIVDFSTYASDDGTYDLIIDGEVQTIDWTAEIERLNGTTLKVTDYQYTNYEAALQEAIEWTESTDDATGPLEDAYNATIFLTDGTPNCHLDSDGNLAFYYSTTLAAYTQEVLDSVSDELATLQNWGALDAVGIDSTDLDASLFNQIFNSPTIAAADYLDSAMPESPVISDLLSAAGDDTIVGGGGDDLIFGDVLYTDDLIANLVSLGILDSSYDTGLTAGSGFAVFEYLENDTTIDWSRTDTINYILDNADSLSANTTIDNEIRAGGNDTILSGDGDDTIYAQEGDDAVSGGDGDDNIDGGIGDDTLLGDDGDDTISAQAGDDTVVGGDGADDIEGGSGDDLLMADDIEIVSSTDAEIVEDGDADTVDGGSGNDAMADASTPQEDTYSDVEYQASDQDIDDIVPLIPEA